MEKSVDWDAISAIVKDNLKDGCPICKHNSFNMPPRIVSSFLTKEPEKLNIQGTSEMLASVAVVCENCGFISHFALNVVQKKKTI